MTRHLEHVVRSRHDHVARIADHEKRPIAEVVEQLGEPGDVREVAGGVLPLVHPLERPAQAPPVEVRAVAAGVALDVVTLRPVDSREHHPGAARRGASRAGACRLWGSCWRRRAGRAGTRPPWRRRDTRAPPRAASRSHGVRVNFVRVGMLGAVRVSGWAPSVSTRRRAWTGILTGAAHPRYRLAPLRHGLGRPGARCLAAPARIRVGALQHPAPAGHLHGPVRALVPVRLRRE